MGGALAFLSGQGDFDLVSVAAGFTGFELRKAFDKVAEPWMSISAAVKIRIGFRDPLSNGAKRIPFAVLIDLVHGGADQRYGLLGRAFA